MKPVQKFFQMYKEYFISGGMIVLAIVGFIFGIIPAIGKTIQLRNDVVELSKTVADRRAKLAILEANDENYYRMQLQELTAAVPTDKSLTTLFSTIDALGARSGVTLTDLTLTHPGSIATQSATKKSTEEKQIGSNLIPFTITVIGDYDQIHEFLVQSVHVRRFFRVKNFEISFEDTSNIVVRMGMDAFYSPLFSASVTADTPIAPLTEKEQNIISLVQSMPIIGEVALPPPSAASPEDTSVRSDPFSL